MAVLRNKHVTSAGVSPVVGCMEKTSSKFVKAFDVNRSPFIVGGIRKLEERERNGRDTKVP